MESSILITGVGGQGTILASKLLAQTAQDLGFFARTSETIGMAQRGGSVTSHVRIGNRAPSPVIPEKKADLIIAFEPSEALRNLRYLKDGGALLVNTHAVIPSTASFDKSYDPEKIVAYLISVCKDAIFADANAICKTLCTYKVLNTVMLGIAAKEGLLPFTKDQLENTVLRHLPEKFREINLRALSI